MLRLCVGLLLVALASGCTGTKTIPVDAEAARGMQGKTITTSARRAPHFIAMTAGKGMLGLFAVSNMIHAGDAVVEANQVDDPAGYIAETLLADLVRKHGATFVDTGGTFVVEEAPEEIAKQYAAAHYLLDVRTYNWGFQHFSTNWSRYAVTLGVQLRFIDTTNYRVMAQSYCYRPPEKTDAAPSLDELLANQAERLKAELRGLADACIGEFRTRAMML